MLRRRPRKTAGRFRLYCNLGYNLSEEVVRRYFQQLCTQGQILDVYIPRHNSGRNKGYGFTTFECEPDLLIALQSPEHVIEGNIVKINRAGPRPDYEHSAALQQDDLMQNLSLAHQRARLQLLQQDHQQQQAQLSAHGRGPRLYVGGIPDDIDEDDINTHFSKWGNVVDIYFPGKSGLKRVNYCFVTFDNWQAAQQACNQSERAIGGRPLQSISLAEERTVDMRESSTGNLQPFQSRFPTPPAASGDWTQQFGNLSLNSLHEPAAASGYLPYAENRSRGGVLAIEDSFREQLVLQSMQARPDSRPMPSQQSPYWLQEYQPQTEMQPPQGFTPSSLAGYAPNMDKDLVQDPAIVGKMPYSELRALQQAMTMNPAYSQVPGPSAGEEYMSWPGQRPQQAPWLEERPPSDGLREWQHAGSSSSGRLSGSLPTTYPRSLPSHGSRSTTDPPPLAVRQSSAAVPSRPRLSIEPSRVVHIPGVADEAGSALDALPIGYATGQSSAGSRASFFRYPQQDR